MGRRGPKTTPTALKKRLGNPGRRPLNEHEPVAPKASLTPPALLRPDAHKYWIEMAPVVSEMGMLTAADVPAFCRYCNLLARYKTLDDFLMLGGAKGTTYVVKDADGKPRAAAEFPQAWEYRQVLNQLLQYEREFGLTPSSRSRLRVEPTTAKLPMQPTTTKAVTLQQFFAAGGPAPPRPAVGSHKARA